MTAMPLWEQAGFCLPLWIVAALCLVLVKALVSTAREKRILWWRWVIVLVFVLVTSLLWANPSQMTSRSGPFSGHVKDADTGDPLPVALLVFQWQGALGRLSTHAAWTLVGEGGSYRLGWQGFGNWRIGAWPGPDSVYVQAPGYATAQFFLDGVERDPYADHDPKAKSASMHLGEIRLQRLRPDTAVNAVRGGIPFGMPAGAERQRVARRFHDVLFRRLCPLSGQSPEWQPTDLAFSQLLSVTSAVEGQRFQPRDTDIALQAIDGKKTPSALDADVTAALCNRFKLNSKE